jgi:hypothetical protein
MRVPIAALALLAAALPAAADPASLDQILESMSEKGRRSFVYGRHVSDTFLSRAGKLSPEGERPGDPYSDGIALLRSAGYAVVTPSSEGPYSIIPLDSAPIGDVRLFDSVDQLPAADEFCGLRIAIGRMTMNEALQGARTLATRVDFVSGLPGNRAVLVTDYASRLRRIHKALADAGTAAADRVSLRVSVAVVEGSIAGALEIPDAFKDAGLDSTGRNRFRLLADGCTSFDLGSAISGRSAVEGQGRVALDIPRRVNVDFVAGPGVDGSVVLERFSVTAPAAGGEAQAERLLEARPSATDGRWSVAGSIPGGKDGSVYLVLVRVEKVR